MPGTSAVCRRLQDHLVKRKIAAFCALLVAGLIPSLLSAVGLFLSLWIVVPAPNRLLLPLGVGAPEVSPWLVGLNTIALLLALVGIHKSWIYQVALVCSVIGIILSSLPLMQLPAANTRMAAEMQVVLGDDYLNPVPQAVQAHLRPHPFVLADAFRGIFPGEVRCDRGIPFAAPDGVSLTLNLYRPQVIGSYPTIVVIYGGAWREGSPNHDELFSRYMAAQGYTVVAIDYRHAPQYQFPIQLEDVQTALMYIQQHAKELEVDIERVVLMGRSAGAHLAMLATYRSLVFPVRAVINYYGPVDLIQGYNDPPIPDPIDTQRVLKDFLGGTPNEQADLYQKASPISYVKPSLPISLLVYAGRDHLVQAKFGRALYEKLRTTGNQTVWLEIPWAEHAFDAVFSGVSNQLALFYTERFLARILYAKREIA
ncbi:alpha/beta hydrolase [Kovacikia minuta CCNUW1]|uniref:alpha/beta hydrolase n=1 Tax=Kovacikia minuta TaxID=2931930 RepID=UPI001CCF1DB6|nr:alpha/beta hydrolase [Kovacikia minuta]UBF27056.1 alpha/beta hydrolase [Kovacikia minuta CCNUW1]